MNENTLEAAHEIAAERRRQTRIVVLSLIIIAIFIAVPAWISLLGYYQTRALNKIVCEELLVGHRQRNELLHHAIAQNEKDIADAIEKRWGVQIAISNPAELDLRNIGGKCE